MKLTQSILAIAAALLTASSALAATHYVVTPNPGRQAPSSDDAIKISLSTASLPDAVLNKSYSYDFFPHLSVTGDPEYDVQLSTFSTNSVLPPGLSLQPNGMLTGTPTSFFEDSLGSGMGTSSLQIVATYKNKTGRQVYTLKIGDRILRVTQISAGEKHTCAIKTNGGVVCWGDNAQGQLGIGTTGGEVLVPTPVADPKLHAGALAIVSGSNHTCAITSSRDLKCWGSSAGTGTGGPQSAPTQVPGFTGNARSVAAGVYHSCAIDSSSNLYCWGVGTNGQIGDGSTNSSLYPVHVLGGAISVATGSLHTCASLVTGVQCWGSNGAGQLGDGTTAAKFSPTSVQSASLSQGARSISAGGNFTCAVSQAGQTFCWGGNAVGQLGIGVTGGSNPYPQLVSGLPVAAEIQVGRQHACARTEQGLVYCWGSNTYMQVGVEGPANMPTPVLIGGLNSSASKLTVGDYNACAVLSSGKPKCWGIGTSGQLGDGKKLNSATPVDVLSE
ncbi:hypothetical protein ACOTC5_30215 [Achromobacter xylosoxidans]